MTGLHEGYLQGRVETLEGELAEATASERRQRERMATLGDEFNGLQARYHAATARAERAEQEVARLRAAVDADGAVVDGPAPVGEDRTKPPPGWERYGYRPDGMVRRTEYVLTLADAWADYDRITAPIREQAAAAERRCDRLRAQAERAVTLLRAAERERDDARVALATAREEGRREADVAWRERVSAMRRGATDWSADALALLDRLAPASHIEPPAAPPQPGDDDLEEDPGSVCDGCSRPMPVARVSFGEDAITCDDCSARLAAEAAAPLQGGRDGERFAGLQEPERYVTGAELERDHENARALAEAARDYTCVHDSADGDEYAPKVHAAFLAMLDAARRWLNPEAPRGPASDEGHVVETPAGQVCRACRSMLVDGEPRDIAVQRRWAYAAGLMSEDGDPLPSLRRLEEATAQAVCQATPPHGGAEPDEDDDEEHDDHDACTVCKATPKPGEYSPLPESGPMLDHDPATCDECEHDDDSEPTERGTPEAL